MGSGDTMSQDFNTEKTRQENAAAQRSLQQRATAQMSTAEQGMRDVTTSVAVLRTEADKTRGLLGFGWRNGHRN